MRADAGCSGAGGHAWVRKPFTLWFWRCLKNTIPLGSHACNCNHLLCCPAFLCPPLLRCLLCRNTFYARVASSSNLILASKAAACALSSSAALLSSALLASSACFAATTNALLDASATSVALLSSAFFSSAAFLLAVASARFAASAAAFAASHPRRNSVMASRRRTQIFRRLCRAVSRNPYRYSKVGPKIAEDLRSSHADDRIDEHKLPKI